MRILLYNFLQPEEYGAGGVGIYYSNLVRVLQGLGHDIILMSSGSRYALYPAKPHVKFETDAFERVHIFNSPVLAPARFSFAVPNIYADSKELDFVPEHLQARYGQIDVFHFQNIEGLTSSFFYELKKTFPDSKMIYSVHNYNLVCSMANLWYQDRAACDDYQSGTRCIDCQSETHDPDEVRLVRKFRLVTDAIPATAGLLSGARRLIGGSSNLRGNGSGEGGALPVAADYAGFRNINIRLCSTVFDHVLAVSKRTRDVIVGMGIPAEKTAVSYIGTKYKATFDTSAKITDIGSGLHLGYLGYVYRKKGFEFLLETLEQLPGDVAATVSLTVGTEDIDPDLYARLQGLTKILRRVTYHRGYTHDQLDQILSGVNLGVVPVQWEDNLPQVAIEMVARGIPILTSDRGGAQEIGNNRDFVFQAGSHSSLLDKISRILRGDVSLGDFWSEKTRLFSMEEHVADLMRYYHFAQLDLAGGRERA